MKNVVIYVAQCHIDM